MPTPFSSIGLPLEDVEDVLRLTREMMAASEEVVFGGGSYLRWRGEGGAEVWIRVDRGGHLQGLTPSFDGSGRLALTLLEETRGPEGSLRDGTYRARTAGGREAPETDLAFDVPDFLTTARRLPLPLAARVQLTAFARRVGPCPPGTGSGTGPAPTGEGSPGPSMSPLATLAGTTLESGERRNPLTGRPFWWSLLRTLGGTVDVVVDPEILPAPPEPGRGLEGEFWLSGRVREYALTRGPLGLRVFPG